MGMKDSDQSLETLLSLRILSIIPFHLAYIDPLVIHVNCLFRN